MTTALSTTETDSLRGEVSPIKANSQALTISVAGDVETARDFIRVIKERRGKVDATFDVHIKAAHAAHKALVATKKTFTDDLDDAERIIKGKVGAYQLECERLARIEQEKARKEAEAAQAKIIESARKRIEATLAKAGGTQEKIVALNYSLEHDNLDDTTRGMVERQLEVLRLQLQGFEDKAAAAQQRAEEIAEAPAYIPPAAVVEKTAGVATKKTYIVTVQNPMALINAISSGSGSAGLVKEWDITMLKKLAIMGIFLVGVNYQEDRTVVVR
jgi:hypothetical protein